MWLTDRFKRKTVFGRVSGAMLQQGAVLLVLALTCRQGWKKSFFLNPAQ
jgi:hypothetical protein